MNERKRQQAVNAEAKAARWLAEANRRREAGKSDEKAYEKAQHWLDRANELRGLC